MGRDELTIEAITAALAQHLDGSVSCTELERGPLGNGQETWFATTTSHRHPQIVLRLTAEAGPLTWTDRTLEAKVMTRVATIDLPVPEVLWVSDGDDAIGRSHLAMQRLPGSPAATARGDERGELLAQLGAALAVLHARSPTDGTATEATRAELERWQDRADDLGALVPPLVHGLLAWLHAELPYDRTPAVQLWGDAGLHNVLAEHGSITGLLDWELSHPGHPLEDVAVAAWMEGAQLDERTTPLLEAYALARGEPVDEAQVRRFLVLAAVTRSLMVIEGARDVIEGRLAAPTLTGLALELPVRSLTRAAEQVGFGSPRILDPPARARAGGSCVPGPADTDAALGRFLDESVLPVVTDGRLRRELKAAIALLETNALRIDGEAQIVTERRDADRALLADLRSAGATRATSLASLAVEVEQGEVPLEVRARVRQHLIDDLTERARTLAPLRARFGG